MKSLALISLGLLISTCSGLSQGQITIANNVASLRAPIFGPELGLGGDWANAKFGNTLTNVPPGTQIYNGGLLTGLIVSFWYAPGTGITDAHLLTSSGVTRTLTDGFFSSANLILPGVTPGGKVTLQVRVSADIPFGPLDFGEGYAAVSPLFTADVPTFGTLLASELRSFDAGWRDGLTLTPFPVPEPSSIALFMLGGGLMSLGRKKHCAS